MAEEKLPQRGMVLIAVFLLSSLLAVYGLLNMVEARRHQGAAHVADALELTAYKRFPRQEEAEVPNVELTTTTRSTPSTTPEDASTTLMAITSTNPQTQETASSQSPTVVQSTEPTEIHASNENTDVTSFSALPSSQTTAYSQETTSITTAGLTSVPSSASPTPNAGTCQLQPYYLNSRCTLSENHVAAVGANVTLQDVKADIFNHRLISKLFYNCEIGTWCLGAYGGNHMYEIPASLELCDLKECLMDIPDDCVTEERSLIVGSLLLLCEMQGQNVTKACWAATRKAQHISAADLQRPTATYQDVCSKEALSSNCSSTCHQMAGNLHCACSACSHQRGLFNQYAPWIWFFSNEEMVESQCSVVNNSCQYFVPVKTPSALETLRNMDAKVWAGVGVSLAVTLAALISLIWACVARISRQHDYSREKVQYAEVSIQDEYDAFGDAFNSDEEA